MKNIFLILLSFVSVQMFAQKPTTQIVQGNKQYNTRNYSQAEALYRSAFSQDDKSTFAAYDKGNAIYRQYQTNESVGSYQQALKSAKTKDEKHRIYHNLGNAFMKQKNYGAAVEAYKNALRNNPNDEETRYNFALAKQMQKDNPNQDNKDNKDNKDQDKKDDKKDQDKNDPKDKGDDKKDQDKKDDKGDEPKDDKKDQGDKDPQQQKQDQSKQQMENMLNALNNQEQKVRERVQGREREGKPVKVNNTKDW